MTPSLDMDHVGAAFGACRALEDVSLSVKPGEVLALVGENGAGKSTLLRVAAGLAPYDRGSVRAGHVLAPGDALDASRAGVAVVHQHFMLVETLSVAHNVVLGAEPRCRLFGGLFGGLFGWGYDHDAARARVRELSARHGLAVDPDARVETLSVGERQRVELLRVLHRGARYVLLDEPTAVLSPREIDRLLETVRALAKDGAGVVLVTHKLREVFAVADAIVVVRRGRMVLSARAGETDAHAVTRAVMGDASDVPAPDRTRSPREEVALAVKDVRAEGLSNVSLSVRAGEVVGIAGVEGSGQRALFHVVAGLEPARGGSVSLGARDVTRAGVLERRRAGLGYVPEDRERGGLCPDLSIEENLALGDPARVTALGRVPASSMRAFAQTAIDRFHVRPADPRARVSTLSGGNAQKVMMAREIMRPLRVLLVAQPTRGIDISAARHVHAALSQARAEGVAVLLVSSELDELRLVCDRVLVMRQGVLVGEFPVDEATDARLGPLMVGAER